MGRTDKQTDKRMDGQTEIKKGKEKKRKRQKEDEEDEEDEK